MVVSKYVFGKREKKCQYIWYKNPRHIYLHPKDLNSYAFCRVSLVTNWSGNSSWLTIRICLNWQFIIAIIPGVLDMIYYNLIMFSFNNSSISRMNSGDFLTFVLFSISCLVIRNFNYFLFDWYIVLYVYLIHSSSVSMKMIQCWWWITKHSCTGSIQCNIVNKHKKDPDYNLNPMIINVSKTFECFIKGGRFTINFKVD